MKCKKCGAITKKKLKFCPECGAKMSSKLGLIITLVVILTLLILAVIGILVYNILKSPYVGTWSVTNAYNDITTTETIKINSNKTFSYKVIDSGSTSNYTINGSWFNDGDHIVLSYSTNNEIQKMALYLVNSNNICLNEKKCKEERKFTKKGLFTSNNKNIIDKDYYTKDEEDDEWNDTTSTGNDSVTETTNKNYSFDNKYDEETDKNKVMVYVFHGEGCSHCAELFEDLAKLDSSIKNKFVVRMYETWYNSANSDLMTKVAKSRNEGEDLGVPYIIIGDKSWEGYTDSYKKEITDTIESEYEKPVNSRDDISKKLGF